MIRKSKRKPTKARNPRVRSQRELDARQWQSAALNGRDRPVKAAPKKEGGAPLAREEGITLKDAWKEMFRFHPTHDEFSAKSVIGSMILASAMLAGAFYLAKMVVNIMYKN